MRALRPPDRRWPGAASFLHSCRVLQDVDASLRTLLGSWFADEKVAITFEPPTPDWAAEQHDPVVDLFLYDVREVLDGRVGEADDVRDDDGRVVGRQSPPRRYHLSYLVSAWAGDPEQEHRMLGRVLEAVPAHDTMPSRFLEGRLVEQGLAVSMRVGAVERGGGAGPTAVWAALGTAARTALELDVIAPLLPTMSTEIAPPAERMSLGVSREDGPGRAAGGAPARPVHGRAGDGTAPGDGREEWGGAPGVVGRRVVRRWAGVQLTERKPGDSSGKASP